MALPDSLDVACSCVVLGTSFLALLAFLVHSATGRAPREALSERVRAVALPAHLCRAGLWAFAPVVRALLALGVTANAITLLSLLGGIAAGLALACGHFGVAGLLFVAASCGDALDGLVARASHTESPGGALFDASVDRYEEFFTLGGLAIYFRDSAPLLTVALAALVGSLMVSYGSAQAEAHHLRVPPGFMRRPERATCLGVGIVLGPLSGVVALHLGADKTSASALPVVLAMVVIGVMANLCAVARIRAVAAALPSRAGAAPQAPRNPRDILNAVPVVRVRAGA